MPDYQAPLRDLRFVMDEMLDYPAHYASLPGGEEATLQHTVTGDAEFDVDWSVSDGDGDLSTVDLTLTQDSDGTTEDTASVSVSGSSASGTTRLAAAGDEKRHQDGGHGTQRVTGRLVVRNCKPEQHDTDERVNRVRRGNCRVHSFLNSVVTRSRSPSGRNRPNSRAFAKPPTA